MNISEEIELIWKFCGWVFEIDDSDRGLNLMEWNSTS